MSTGLHFGPARGLGLGRLTLRRRRVKVPRRLVVLGGGQSLMAYLLLRGSPRVALIWAKDLRDMFGFSGVRPFASYGSGAMVHDGSSVNADDWTVRILNSASGGSALMSETNAGETAGGNYWWNTTDASGVTGNPLDTAGSPGPLLRAAVARAEAELAAGVEISAIAWSQGTTEATYIGSNPARRALYKATMLQVLGALRAVHPRAVVLIHRIGRHQTSANAGYEAIRNVQSELARENPQWIFIAAEEYAERFGHAGVIANASTQANSNVVTLANTSGLTVNMGVAGPGIPEGAFITAIAPNASVTLNVNASASATGITLYRVDAVHLYPGIDSAQPFDGQGGAAHNTADGFYAVCRRSARKTARVLGVPGITGTDGPRLTGIAAAAAGGAVIDVAVQHDAGTDIVVPDATSWRVEVNGSARTINSVARQNETTIRITLAAGLPSGDLAVYYAYGAMNRVNYTKFVRDNAPVPMPLQPTCPALTAVI